MHLAEYAIKCESSQRDLFMMSYLNENFLLAIIYLSQLLKKKKKLKKTETF